MMMARIYFYIVVFLLSCFVLQAQYRFDNHKKLTAADGLPTDLIFDIAEDQYGFIWLATAKGLVRYDGNKFSKVEKIASDSVHLPSDYIVSILVRGDSLWVGTNKGLSILNLSNGQISNYNMDQEHFKKEMGAGEIARRHYVSDIYEDRQKNVWLAPAYGGFVKWDRHAKEFMHYPLFPDKTLSGMYPQIDQTSLIAIIQDTQQDSVLWGASKAGLVKLNTITKKPSRILFQEINDYYKFHINRKICIYQSPEDRMIYSGSWIGGLSVYDPVSGTYVLPALKYAKDFQRMHNLKLNQLLSIIPGEDGLLYLTYGNGLFTYDLHKKTFQIIKKNIAKKVDERYGIDFIDSQKRLWDATHGGLYVSDPIEHQFQFFSLEELNTADIRLLTHALTEDFYPDYISLTGQFGDGVYHVNLATGHQFKVRAEEHLKNNRTFDAMGMTRLNDSTLIIAEGHQLYTLDKTNEKLIPYDIQVPLKNHFQKQIAVDDHSTLWVTTSADGLFSIDIRSKTITQHVDEVPYTGTNHPFKDSRNNIWIATNYGHVVFDRKQNQFRIFDHRRDSSSAFFVSRPFCECPNGEVWLSGDKAGIGLVSGTSPEKGIIQKREIKDKQGKTVTVYRIACSPDNALWGMNGGNIFKINKTTWTADQYSLTYGVSALGGGFQFLKNGKLFLGSRDGFYTVDPEQLYRNTILPRPYVQSIVTNRGPKHRIEDHLNQKPVHIAANENVMTITFSAINHSFAEKTKYQYMLQGLDEGWIDAGEKRSLNYSYLPGGNYVFKLRACNNEEIWNDQIYELPIHIGTPWYKTMLFWSALICLFLGLAYAYYRQQIAQVRKESRLAEQFEKQKAELEMSALRAQMNPHFIFNCLNSIESYIIKNDTKKASEYLNRFGRLIRLILQNSRGNYVNLQDELEALNLYIQLEQMRFKNSFSYAIILADSFNPENYEIPPMLIQPYVENAIWHGLNHRENGGEVSIKIQKIDDVFRCIIEDNGIGRVASTKIQDAKKIKRKSMGMDITQERIEIVNKIYNTQNKVEIEDLYNYANKAVGTRVTLFIPL